MRHKNRFRKFGREHDHRVAMLNNLVISLIENGRIETTTAKAKEIRSIAEKVVTLGKRGDLHARRLAYKRIPNRVLISKIFGELAERFKTRPGGYTRIMHTQSRFGDNAPMSIIEFV